MKSASGLAPSQSRKGTNQAVSKTKPRPTTAALLWLLLLIMNKFLAFSRGYGYPDDLVFILVALTKLSKGLPASDGLFLFWSYVITISTATWQQTGSPKANSAAHPRALKGLYMVMFICATYKTSCVTKGQGRIPQPHSVEPAEAIIMTILLWECLKGGWC